MNKQTEALKMAIKALQNVYFENEQLSFVDNAESNWKQRQNAIKACKEALDTKRVCENEAQPAQEPAGWMEADEYDSYMNEHRSQLYAYCLYRYNPMSGIKEEYQPDLTNAVPFYTHPAPSWQGLSDDEIVRIANGHLDCVDEEYIKRFARAIEQELKEKNGN